ncbi:hypothetical protein HMI54_004416 [Coelomomyces lativittatus]|nr:hypothetical protein HMI55_004823 [Coelomomyces lativittatus]KAJ1507157.1 hypothetical protein HMI54_004416 [Coelomomyces lativittatus]
MKKKVKNICRVFVQEHKDAVASVLQRLINANLTVTAEEADFGTDQAKVLATVLLYNRRRADPN